MVNIHDPNITKFVPSYHGYLTSNTLHQHQSNFDSRKKIPL